jgi:zinc transporter 9
MTDYAHGKKSAIAALLGNIFVTIFKTIIFFITGSTSMFAESVHSLADTLNQSLLLIGIKRSRKPADNLRGYGYGIERFFWSLISACGILFIGSGITIYHSFDSLLHPSHSAYIFNVWSLFVLILAFAIESTTLGLALRELTRGRKISQKVFEEADPVLLAIIYEDSVAVAGVIIVLGAQWLTYLTGKIFYDAVGGIAVGLILGFLAILLIIKNHQYIIGKSLNQEVVEGIIEELEKDSCIEHVVEFKSSAIDVGKYRIFVTVEWNGSPLYEEIYEAGDLKEEFEEIKNDFKEFTRLIFKITDRIPRLVGNRIDIIEKNIIEKFPQVAYVDIEIN